MASGSRSCNAKACHALGLTCTSSSVMLAATLSHTCVSDHLLQEAQESASTAHRAAMCFSCLGLQSSTFDTYQEVKLLATSLAWLNMTCCTVIWLLHPQ